MRLPISTGASDNLWAVNVVEPSVNIIKSLLDKPASPEANNRGCEEIKLAERDLWTQYVCQVSPSHFFPPHSEFEYTLKYKIAGFSYAAVTELSSVQFLVRHVVIRSLEVHMNGNNINRAVATANEYRG